MFTHKGNKSRPWRSIKRQSMKSQRWGDLTLAARVRIVVLGAIQMVLLGAALWDLRRRSAEQVRGSKFMWLALSFINYVGPLAYFLIGRRESLQ